MVVGDDDVFYQPKASQLLPVTGGKTLADGTVVGNTQHVKMLVEGAADGNTWIGLYAEKDCVVYGTSGEMDFILDNLVIRKDPTAVGVLLSATRLYKGETASITVNTNDPNGGIVSWDNGTFTEVKVPMDEMIGTAMPADPVREDYRFVEWNTGADGTGETVTAETEVYENMDAYAIWERIEYTVSFHANGGTVEPESAVTVNGKLPELPVPTREGYSFAGWYHGETKVTTDTVYEADTELTAKREKLHAITAEFVRNSWLGTRTVSIEVDPGSSIQAPNANGFFQSGNGWMSEDGSLYVDSKGTVTYAQLAAVLGGQVQEGAVVRFKAVRTQDVP